MASGAPWVQGALVAGLLALYWLSQAVWPSTGGRGASGRDPGDDDVASAASRQRRCFAAGLACTAAYAVCILVAAVRLVMAPAP